MEKETNITLHKWVLRKLPMFFIYNVIVMLLVLMHSVGYFDPFFPISVNVIVMVSIVLAVLLLRLNSRFVFATTCFFWLVSAFFQISHIDIWAERAGIYTYESLFVGAIVLVAEVLITKGKSYFHSYSKRFEIR